MPNSSFIVLDEDQHQFYYLEPMGGAPPSPVEFIFLQVIT